MVAPDTDAIDLIRVLDANSTAADFTAKAPSSTQPTGDGVVDLAGSSITVRSNIIILPYGTDADGETFGLRLWGWSYAPALNYWFPVKLLEIACTLGSQAAGFTASHFLVDTITVTHGSFTAVSPADNTSAFVFGKLHGVQLIEFDFDLGTGAAMNALYRTYNPAQ